MVGRSCGSRPEPDQTRPAFRAAVRAAIERRRLQRTYRHQLQCPPAERAELVDAIADCVATAMAEQKMWANYEREERRQQLRSQPDHGGWRKVAVAIAEKRQQNQ
ncbi:hypothetical protein [Geminicoccus harenae]|uniref:hypothetical protein n=1 Tax=Geminicoccus harenae TaxID=2498453 RepID=UPI00168B8102|nr:hypothetical protein [Geminicoccus harenae]